MRLQKFLIIVSVIFLGVLGAGGIKEASSQSLPADLFNDPRALFVNEQEGRLYVFNNKSAELVVLDIASRSLIKSIKLETDASSAAYNSKTKKIYFSHFSTKRISVIKESEINQENYQPKSIEVAEGLFSLAIDEKLDRIYGLSAVVEGNIFVIDGSSDSLLARWPVGFRPSRLIFNNKNDKIYVLGGPRDGVSLIDAKTGKIQKTFGREYNFLTAELDEEQDQLYLAEAINNEIIVLDGGLDKVLGRLKVGLEPRNIAISKELGRVYVSNFLDDSVSVIDAKNSSLIDTIYLEAGAYPAKAIVNNLTSKSYIPNTGLNKITIVDAKTGKLIKEVQSGGNKPNYGQINFSSNEIYFLNEESNSLVVIDGVNDSQKVVLPPQAEIGGPIFDWPGDFYLDEDKNLIYITNRLNGTLTVIDGETNQPTKVVPLGSQPQAISLNKNYNKIYVNIANEDSVAVLDREELSVIKYLKVGKRPQAINFNSRNNKVYVLNFDSGTLSVIDGKTDSLIKEIKLSKRPMARIQISSITNRVYIPDLENPNRIFVIDGQTDEIIKELMVPNLLGSGRNFWVGEVGGKLYAYSASEGKVLVLDEADYQVLQNISVPPYSVVGPLSYISSIYVGREDGYIDVIDERDGKVVKKIFIGKPIKIGILYRFSFSVNGTEGDRLIILDNNKGILTIYDDKGDTKLLFAGRIGHNVGRPFANHRTGKVYLANTYADSLSVFDSREGKLLAIIDNTTPLLKIEPKTLFPSKFKMTRLYYFLSAFIIILGLVAIFVLRRKKSISA